MWMSVEAGHTSRSMANPPRAHDQQSAGADESADGPRETGSLEAIAPTLAPPIRKTGFWVAIVLPFLYLPVLANGLSSRRETAIFLVLLGVNLGALYIGHAYKQ